ncbi:hypothetical protein [Microbacterium sp. NIBRBAC000506063]|uniref:hypothetical protein n=1 Tax=Microbacterium sp. NIBRBAC000506063 TaxID=2734618 RepID=UPI001BB53F25|nr:hypothetical protein [Microbacterium sp. NIBRBAC000506063]QTV79159.1 hypothetical protein KAE78_08740 [Microbacterium sp. NIBRBAC000506063]
MSDAVDDALRSLERSDGLDEPQRESHSIGWYFHVDVEGERASRTAISPEEVHFTWNEDLSARIRVVAGTPSRADDPALALPSDAPRAGEVLRDEVFAPGEYDPLLPDPPGRTPAELEEFLQPIALGGLSSGFALFDAIDTAFQAWSLTNEQQGSLLELIDDASGVTVLGAGLDRAGRPVIGLSTTHPDVAQERHILVSQETGRIIGFEIYMVEGDDYFPGNAVISYTLYEGRTREEDLDHRIARRLGAARRRPRVGRLGRRARASGHPGRARRGARRRRSGLPPCELAEARHGDDHSLGRSVGSCATGSVCAFSQQNISGTKLSWGSCSTHTIPGSFSVKSIANARSAGSILQARNGTTVLASATGGTWKNVAGTTTNVRCLE